MLTDPPVVTPDTSSMRVAELMNKHDLDWILVVEDTASRRLIGVIGSERILRSLISHRSN